MDNDSTPNAIEELKTELKAAIEPPKPKAAPKPRKANAHKADKPKAQPSSKERQVPGHVDAKYITAHRIGLTHVAKALGFTLDEFIATKTSKGVLAGYRNVDIRAHRPVTARVFAQVPAEQFADVRSVFAFVCCRSERLADALRAAGKARK